MKLILPPAFAAGANWRRRPAQKGFTMVEIALCLGIIAFALVAIVGVLPTGLTVQRENREDTVINRDGSYFLEAIRSGSEGLDDLTNFVESIKIVTRPFPFTAAGRTNDYVFGRVSPGVLHYENGQHIIGLLSRPKYEFASDGTLLQNTVTAMVKGISGRALDRSPSLDDMAFRYNMVCEVTPFTNTPPALMIEDKVFVNLLQTTNLSHNLYDVRLTMRWPIFERAQGLAFGRRRATFRTLASGEMTITNALGHDFYFLQPAMFNSQM